MQRLEALGFEWRVAEDADAIWDKRFAQLGAYKAAHGDCIVPRGYKANQQLGTWVMNQRKLKVAGKLSQERVARLDALGFEWNVREDADAVWEQRFAELEAHKALHGDCKVPQKHKPNPQLGKWVKYQRQLKTAGKLAQERVARLEALGFEWNGLKDADEAWQQRFAELEAYHALHGDCKVPRVYKPNPQLATWVGTQRVYKAAGKLPQERVQRLEALGGFEWSVLDDIWERRFREREAYKAANGHCNVPQRYEPNQQLAAWVMNLRARQAAGKPAQKRMQRLEALGFAWRA
jgi:hypothetical protein